jgi:hypothetical protein
MKPWLLHHVMGHDQGVQGPNSHRNGVPLPAHGRACGFMGKTRGRYISFVGHISGEAFGRRPTFRFLNDRSRLMPVLPRSDILDELFDPGARPRPRAQC